MDKDMSRRGFLETMGAMGVALGVSMSAASAMAEEATPSEGEAQDGDYQLGDYIMTEEEALAALAVEPEVTEDFVQPDGTVVPAAYLRLRNRINRMGIGVGSLITGDGSWDWYLKRMSEDDAIHFCEMPIYVWFTAFDYAEVSGRDPQECAEICEDLARRGFLGKAVRGGIAHFHITTQMYGMYETFALPMDLEFDTDFWRSWGGDNTAGVDYGTPMYHSVPVNAEIIGEQQGVLPYDDWRAVIERNEFFAVAPCVCRKNKELRGERVCDDDQHPLETCITLGEEAQYYIENGFGREITKEEAIAILERSVDLGMVIDHLYSKKAESICSCHSDCCMWLGTVRAADGEGNVMAHISNYNLVYDGDTCIKCGACIERCPMRSISFGEDGLCVMDKACVRCGQCATVCPVGARSLVAKAPEDRNEYPEDMVGDYIEKAVERMRKGYIVDFVG